MKNFRTLIVAAVLILPVPITSCGGSDDKTVVVQPQPSSTVVVPSTGATKVCPSGQTTC
jgi:hypothetical protein